MKVPIVEDMDKKELKDFIKSDDEKLLTPKYLAKIIKLIIKKLKK